jgi:hypothetical protein
MPGECTRLAAGAGYAVQSESVRSLLDAVLRMSLL